MFLKAVRLKTNDDPVVVPRKYQAYQQCNILDVSLFAIFAHGFIAIGFTIWQSSFLNIATSVVDIWLAATVVRPSGAFHMNHTCRLPLREYERKCTCLHHEWGDVMYFFTYLVIISIYYLVVSRRVWLYSWLSSVVIGSHRFQDTPMFKYSHSLI